MKIIASIIWLVCYASFGIYFEDKIVKPSDWMFFGALFGGALLASYFVIDMFRGDYS